MAERLWAILVAHVMLVAGLVCMATLDVLAGTCLLYVWATMVVWVGIDVRRTERRRQ